MMCCWISKGVLTAQSCRFRPGWRALERKLGWNEMGAAQTENSHTTGWGCREKSAAAATAIPPGAGVGRGQEERSILMSASSCSSQSVPLSGLIQWGTEGRSPSIDFSLAGYRAEQKGGRGKMKCNPEHSIFIVTWKQEKMDGNEYCHYFVWFREPCIYKLINITWLWLCNYLSKSPLGKWNQQIKNSHVLIFP